MPTVRTYLSLIKFSHTIFAMPFAMIGFFLALTGAVGGCLPFRGALPSSFPGTGASGSGGSFGYVSADSLLMKLCATSSPIGLIGLYLLLVVACMVFARSAAMAFNRYLDRSFDARNPRTAIREIPSGILKANSVLWFTIVNCVLFVTCTFFINRTCFYLSPIALAVVLGYSYTKRFTPLCHLVLGLGLSLAPIGAYLAVTGAFALLPVLFSFAVIFWVSGFDIIYALQDEEFDRSEKLFSMPSWLGKARALRVSEVLHLLSAACVVAGGLYGKFHWLYWAGVAVFAGMLVYQHSIVKPNDLRKVNIAFMTANGVASIVFALFVIADLFIN
ncbi:MAG: 4-hydroxybenzoate octaprenyltransferase [Chitinophagaceae bacterium]|nr:MAG: 4-hydroxybenzoate octaprenyltransferase [Chitinophagaceae bacterium]